MPKAKGSGGGGNGGSEVPHAGITPAQRQQIYLEEAARIKQVQERVAPLPKETLPYITEIANWDASELDKVMEAIEEHLQLSAVVKQANDRLGEIRNQLVGIAVGNEVKGFVTDTAKVTVRVDSRSTLNKDKVLEHIPASVLEACYVKGVEYYVAKVELIKEKREI